VTPPLLEKAPFGVVSRPPRDVGLLGTSEGFQKASGELIDKMSEPRCLAPAFDLAERPRPSAVTRSCYRANPYRVFGMRRW